MRNMCNNLRLWFVASHFRDLSEFTVTCLRFSLLYRLCFSTSDWAELCRRTGTTGELWWHFTRAVVYSTFVISEQVCHKHTHWFRCNVILHFGFHFPSRSASRYFKIKVPTLLAESYSSLFKKHPNYDLSMLQTRALLNCDHGCGSCCCMHGALSIF